MKFTPAQKILFILIFNIWGLSVAAQSADNVLQIANQQYILGNYSLALKEYQRYFFFHSEPDAPTFFNIGSCFQNLGEWDNAVEFYDKAFINFNVDSLKRNALFKKIECYIFAHEYGLALTELLGISDTIPREDLYKREFYSGICYFGMNNFDEAGKSFINAVNPANTQQIHHLQQIFKNPKKFKRPNPLTAYVLSMWFPGLGQFYAGDIRDGINSLLLTTGLIAIGVDIAVNQSFLDAGVTMLPWIQRYYQGGYMKAEEIAITRRTQKRAAIYKEILNTIKSSKIY